MHGRIRWYEWHNFQLWISHCFAEHFVITPLCAAVVFIWGTYNAIALPAVKKYYICPIWLYYDVKVSSNKLSLRKNGLFVLFRLDSTRYSWKGTGTAVLRWLRYVLEPDKNTFKQADYKREKIKDDCYIWCISMAG